MLEKIVNLAMYDFSLILCIYLRNTSIKEHFIKTERNRTSKLS